MDVQERCLQTLRDAAMELSRLFVQSELWWVIDLMVDNLQLVEDLGYMKE